MNKRRGSFSPPIIYWLVVSIFLFTPTWVNDPILLIFFKRVETTNQYRLRSDLFRFTFPEPDFTFSHRQFEMFESQVGIRRIFTRFSFGGFHFKVLEKNTSKLESATWN